MASTIKEGEEGVEIELDTNDDITGATVTVEIKDPNGVESSETAAITDATNGLLSFNTTPTTFTVLGTWRLWAKVVLAGPSRTFKGDTAELIVLDEFEKEPPA